MSGASKNRRYARVYFDDLERDHPDVWFDPTCLSTWVRFLALSEKAWPTMPELPRSARRADLEKLVSTGMLELLPNHRFVLRGWKKEREERSVRALDALGHRRDRVTSKPTLVPTDVGTSVPTDDVYARAGAASAFSYSSSKEGVQGKPPDPADAYWSLTGRYPTDRPISWIDDLTAQFGAEAVIRALATAHGQDSHTNTLIGRAQDILRSEARVLATKEQAAVRAQLAERRAAPRDEVDPAALQAEIEKILRGEAA